MFGQGPRNCIGMRYALLALKIAFVFMLRKYRLVPCSKTTKEIEVNLSILSIYYLLLNKEGSKYWHFCYFLTCHVLTTKTKKSLIQCFRTFWKKIVFFCWSELLIVIYIFLILHAVPRAWEVFKWKFIKNGNK